LGSWGFNPDLALVFRTIQKAADQGDAQAEEGLGFI
jgi:hypothetical protein